MMNQFMGRTGKNDQGKSVKGRPQGNASKTTVVKESVKEKRAFHKEWAQFFDRALPKSILNLCLENECKLCKVSLKHEVMAKQHFEGKTHAKNVNLELEEIFKTSGKIN